MLKTERKLPLYDYKESCTFYLFVIIASLLAQGILGVVGTLWQQSNPDIMTDPDFNTAYMIFAQLVNCAMLFGYSKVRKRRLNFIYAEREDGANIAIYIFVPIAIGAALMTGAFLPSVWYTELMGVVGIPEDFGALDLDTPSSVAMLTVSAVALAPVFEESVYRGVLLGGLRDGKKPVVAVLLCAMSFMFMHMNPMQVVLQFALGAVCACIVIRTERVLPAIITHAASNALALVISYTSLGNALNNCVAWMSANPAAAVFITIGIAAAAAGVIYVLIRFCLGKKGRSAKERAEEQVIDGSQTDGQSGAQIPLDKESAALLKKLERRNGTIMYWIAAGICIVMFIVNFVAAVIV